MHNKIPGLVLIGIIFAGLIVIGLIIAALAYYRSRPESRFDDEEDERMTKDDGAE